MLRMEKNGQEILLHRQSGGLFRIRTKIEGTPAFEYGG
jgi:hypothetical protein